MTFCKDGSTFTLINIHNANLSIFEVSQILDYLQRCRFWDIDHPTSSFTMLVGDLNFSAPGERRYVAGRPSSSLSSLSSTGLSASAGPAHRGKLMQELALWIEMAQPFPTCYSPVSETSSRIDRGWVSATSAAILQLDVSSSVSISAEENYSGAISDHALVDFYFGPRRSASLNNGADTLPPIPSFISKHPYFGELVPIYAEEMKLKDCPAETKLDLFNSALRAIGREVRDHLLTHDPDGNDSKRLVLNSISRAVWGQKDRLARQLLRSSELARRHLYIDMDLGVMLIDPVKFDSEFNEVRLNDRNATIGRLQGDLGRAASSNTKKRVVSQLQAHFRMRAASFTLATQQDSQTCWPQMRRRINVFFTTSDVGQA